MRRLRALIIVRGGNRVRVRLRASWRCYAAQALFLIERQPGPVGEQAWR